MSFFSSHPCTCWTAEQKNKINGAHTNTNTLNRIRTQNASEMKNTHATLNLTMELYLHIVWYVFGSNWSVKVTRTKRKSSMNSKTAYTVLWITKIWDRTWKHSWGKPNTAQAIYITLPELFYAYILIDMKWNGKKQTKKKQRKNFSMEKKKVTTQIRICERWAKHEEKLRKTQFITSNEYWLEWTRAFAE